MKLNPLQSLFAAGMAALLGYLIHTLTTPSGSALLTAIASGVCFAATLIPTLALKHESAAMTTNLRVLSAVFFVAFCISHVCFATIGVTMPLYVIVNGLLLLLFLATLSKMASMKNI